MRALGARPEADATGVQCAVCRVQGLGCRVQGERCGLDLRQTRPRTRHLAPGGDFQLQTSGLRFRILDSGSIVQGGGLRVYGLWFMVYGLGCRVQGSGFIVYGLGCRVQSS